MKPILFSTEMVKAILKEQKTQTRRVIKPQPVKEATMFERFIETVDCGLEARFGNDISTAVCDRKVPYKPGDILWVRETWQHLRIKKPHRAIPIDFNFIEYIYKADGEIANSDGTPFKWRPSIHMPREAARIFLRVTHVRVERLQEITEEDAIAEGVKDPYDYQDPEFYEQLYMRGLEINKSAFAGLWDSLNAKRGYGWDKNPFVWVVEFERVSKEEAERLEGKQC